uniref:histidine kinase n=1 Tax=Globisporangium ultimum (strain ATCC 200006 / CBS 805.95 / DAOM BR144) TaxID=431595 RepID=K3WMM8_GLOUD
MNGLSISHLAVLNLLKDATAPVVGISTDGVVTLWNKCLVGITGFATDSVLGRPLQEFIIGPARREELSGILANAKQLDHQQPLNVAGSGEVHLPLRTASGGNVQILTSLTPLMADDGTCVGLYGIGQDVTELTIQEKQYAAVIMQANAPIIELDKDATITVWNSKTASITGYPSESMVGEPLLPLVDPSFRDIVAENIEQTLRTGIAGADFDLPLITATGARIEIASCLTPRFDTTGAVGGIVAIGQDVTEHNAKKMEYRKFIDSANAPIFGMDLDGRVVIFNTKAEQTSEFTTEEVMGKDLVETLISEDYRPAVAAVFQKACQGIETANFEFPLITKSGRKIEILLNATPRYDHTGQLAGVIGIGQDITDRIIQEQEYSRLIDTANAPIFGVNRDCEVIIWNKKAATSTQYTNEDTMGKGLLNFISAEYRKAVGDVLAKALDGEETANFEFPLITKSGRRLDILLNATPKYDHFGNISGVVGIGQDITDRRAQEQEYTRLIDTANAPIFGVDKDLRVNIWNRKAAQTTEYSVFEVLGASLVENFIPEEYQEEVGSVLSQALQGIETANFEFPLITKSGRRVEILLNATPRYDEKGAIIGVVGIGQDITIRIAQEREYSRLIDTANAPIFGVDKNGLVNIWNKKAAEITQFTSEDVIGKDLVKLVSEENRDAVGFALRKALAGAPADNFDFPLITKAGRRVEILLNATPRYNERGIIVGVVGIGQDITERLAQEQEYTRLIDSANAPIFGVDVNGCVNIWNKKAAEITQYTPSDVMGENLVEKFITEDYREAVSFVLSKALNGTETANFEFPLITKTGRRVEILLNATSRLNEHGEVIGMVGIGQDITERIAQEQEYTRLIDKANAPIFGIDVNGAVNIWNRKAAVITQYETEEVIGENLVNKFISEDYREAVATVFAKALEGDESANFDLPLITKTGRKVNILLNATARFDQHGDIVGAVGIGQDITERMAQEQEYTRLIDTANAPIFGVDVNGCVNIWNKKAAEITQYTPSDVMGENLVEKFITEDYREAVGFVLTKAINGVETANFEFPLMTKTGRRVEILLNATSRFNEHGEVMGMVGIGQDITDRIAQEQEYTRLIDSANAPIFGVDVNGCVNIWNKKAAEITQYTPSDVMGENLVEKFITEDYREAVSFVLSKALNGTETANFEFPLMTKTGRRVEILLNATSRFNEHGEVMGMVGIGQDITERIAQEQEYTSLIDSANAPIFGVDVNGCVNIWNKKAAEITQYTPSDVMGENLVEKFITEDYREAVSFVLSKALNGTETANFEFPLITKTGRRVEILLNATSRLNEHGEVIGMVGIGQDITERIAQEQEYTRLIDKANAPIFGIDVNGAVNIWNRKAAVITQYETEEVIGENLVNKFISEDYREAVATVFAKALEGDESANFDLPLITKTGRKVNILLNATARFDQHGDIVGVVGIGQDITERMAQEQEYTRLIDTANAPIFGVDVNGCVNIWNKKAAEITQYTPSDVMGENLVEKFITEDYREAVGLVLSEALDGVETANFEFPLMTKTGRRVEILLNATSRFNEHGEVMGMVGIGQDITDRIAQEQEYTRLIDTANAPIFGVDSNGRVNIWNRKAADITQYTNADVLGEDLVEKFISEEYRAPVRSVLEKAFEGVETANFEFPLITKSGRRVEILLNATPKFDQQGKIVGVVGIGQDITDRIAQEQEYSRLIDTANAPIFGVDANMCVNIWNKKAAQITSYSISEVMGENLVETFISPEFRPIVAEVLSKALQGIQTANFEFPLITRPGTRIEILLNATPRNDSNGNIVGVVGIGQDITDRIAQEHEYFRLIDTANAPIFGVDTNGCINEWNQKIVEITGYQKASVLGLSLVNTFIIPESRQQVRQLLNQALIGIDVGEMELPMTTKRGSFLLLLVNASSKKDMHGNIRGVIGVGQDYTARKHMEQAKVNFLASFSHELRTPLNGVLGMLELLKEQKLTAQNERYVHMAYVSGSLLLNLINDILDLSKIEAGHLEITAAPFQMNELLDYSIEIFKFKARERGLKLEMKCDDNVPNVAIGDVVRLRQVLLNLLSNAIKFTNKGSITVSCNVVHAPDLPKAFKRLLFQVIDTGIGMDAEEKSRLFSLFTKLERTRQNNPTGSGLGLAICKQLVELMDGQIEVDSELELGSNFYFTVVVRLVDEDSDAQNLLYASDEYLINSSAKMSGSAGGSSNVNSNESTGSLTLNGPSMPIVIPTQARILVVEDNDFNWEVVKCYLQEDDHLLQWEVNGHEAVNAYIKHYLEFDLIFMDCEMPVMDGYTATATIRQFEQDNHLPRIPILGLTAYAMSGDRQKCLEAGMDEFMVKPISKS